MIFILALSLSVEFFFTNSKFSLYQHAGYENAWIYAATNSKPHEYDERQISKSQNCEIVNLIPCPCGLILILSCLFL